MIVTILVVPLPLTAVTLAPVGPLVLDIPPPLVAVLPLIMRFLSVGLLAVL